MEPSSRSVPLEQLLRRLPESTRIDGARDVRVTGIAIDSRAVQPGALFIALRGERTDGHRFVEQAAARGAAAVVVEHSVPLPGSITAVVVADSARAASQLADEFFERPSRALRVAGVTGTNGKTTTTHMIAAMLEAAGQPCGVIGTVGARFGSQTWALENTTPLAPELHHVLAAMRDDGAKAAAIEVSSHALALERVTDVSFAVGALTNVTRDHLDFHQTFDAYASAKRRLFDLAEVCVLNADDEHGERWSRELRMRKKVVTYALRAAADIRAANISLGADGSAFYVDGVPFTVRIPGKFNVENALCALAVCRVLGASDSAAASGLATLERVPGRMEHLHASGIDVLVDYAHTPDALENLLRAARDVTARRVLVVFGCGGDRDRGKRPEMGAIASRLADAVFVTSDNPRNEDPQAIVDAILAGTRGDHVRAIVDRRAAIEAAVAEAEDGDVVVVAGKGHEAYQIVGTRTLPFDDMEEARNALHAREAAKSSC